MTTEMTMYAINGRVVLRRIGEDVLLVPVSGPAATDGGRVYPLNATAEIIWSHLVAGARVPDIVDDLVKRYEATREQVQADVADCIETFLSEHLLNKVAL